VTTPAFTFNRATKKQAKARIALAGPSGSGKTYTSLLTAHVLAERVAVIDTEHRSASKYADEFTFDVLEVDRYDPALLVHALAAAGSAGYDAVVVDSLSHFWMGSDGMLEQVDRAAKRSGGGNSFAGWKEMRPVERRMVEAMLAYPGHVIVTMRTKTEYVVEENERGKKVPRKIGTKPEQRDGIEYEFDIVGDLDLENELIIAKTRCRALAGAVIRKPDQEFGRTIAKWLDDGVDSGPTVAEIRAQALAAGRSRDELLALLRRVEQLGLGGAPILDEFNEATTLADLIVAKGRALANRPAADQPAEDKQHRHMHALWRQAAITDRDERLAYTTEWLGRQVESSKDLTVSEADRLISKLNDHIRLNTPPEGAVR
jgi:AAA domain-containing protein